MRKLFSTICLIAVISLLHASTPQGLKYQAVIRNSTGQILSNQDVSIRISILEGSSVGNDVCIETFNERTDAYGMINLVVGSQDNSFNNIDWSTGTFFIKVEIDSKGGSSYITLGTSQLLSVPYALYANEAGNTFSGDYNDLDNKPDFLGWDSDNSDDFDGQWNSLSGSAPNISEFTNDVGYLTEHTAEVDGSITNEIQDLQLIGNILTITRNGSATSINLSSYLDNTDTHLSEIEVDNYVGNNGYLTIETDGSITNEIQDLQLIENILTITKNGSASSIDLSSFLDNVDTQLSEAQVDNFVSNNGYLTSEIDNSITNEIQDLQLIENILTITKNGSATSIDLSPYLDNTDTHLSESQVDSYVSNNGYLTIETDSSTTNEIQNLESVLSQGNAGGLVQIKNIADPTDAQDVATKAYVDLLIAQIDELTISIGATDIEGNKYKIVKIGDKIWMAENLRSTKYSDQTPIPEIQDNTAWVALGDNNTDKAYCYFDNDNTSEYGALYTWAAAMNGSSESTTNPSNVQGVCPTGWHLPSRAEWIELEDYLGGDAVAGGKLKEVGTTNWLSPNEGATNESGFSALPGGGRHVSGGWFYGTGGGNWWSTSEISSTEVMAMYLTYDREESFTFQRVKSYGYSVRCVKD